MSASEEAMDERREVVDLVFILRELRVMGSTVTATFEGVKGLEDRMGALEDQVNQVVVDIKSAITDATTRVVSDIDALKTKVAAGVDPAVVTAALDELKADITKINDIDATVPAATPPAGP